MYIVPFHQGIGINHILQGFNKKVKSSYQIITLYSTVFFHPLVLHQLFHCVSVLGFPLQHLPYKA